MPRADVGGPGAGGTFRRMDKKLLRAAVLALSVAWLAALALVIDGEGPSTLLVPSIGVVFSTLVYLRRTARKDESPSTTPQEERRSRLHRQMLDVSLSSLKAGVLRTD